MDKQIIIKNRKVQEIALYVLSFVVVPIISVLISMSSDESPVFTSLSRMLWVYNMVPVVALFGIANFATFLYAIFHVLQTGQYNKKWKLILYLISSFGILLIIVGVSIPAYYIPENSYYVALRTAHATLTAIGIFVMYFALILIAITTYLKNIRQGILETFILCSMLIICGFSIFKINDPNSYCTTSAVSQVIIFSLLNISLTLFSIFNQLFKADSNK